MPVSDAAHPIRQLWETAFLWPKRPIQAFKPHFLPPRPAIRISLAVGAVRTADPTGALRVPLALLQPSLLTVIIFRSFLEPQINWKCFTSVGFFLLFFFF